MAATQVAAPANDAIRPFRVNFSDTELTELRRRISSQSGSNGSTRLNPEAGSTWPNPNSASCRASVSPAEFQTSQATEPGRRLAGPS
jgi:hypothetical protein